MLQVLWEVEIELKIWCMRLSLVGCASEELYCTVIVTGPNGFDIKAGLPS